MQASEDFEAYRERAYRFLWEEIEPRAEEWDSADEMPREELWDDFTEMGFLGLSIPAEYGGLGLTTEEYVQLEKEWAKVYGGLRVVLHAHNVCARLIAETGTDAQREQYLPAIADGDLSFAIALTEPHAGSGTDVKTTAERDGDGYVLNGQKHHITNADFADYMITVARSPSGFSNVLVPRDADGLTITEGGEAMGNLGSHHCYLEFDDLRVPAENVLGTEGEGLRATVEGLQAGRIYIAANAWGIAERCFEASVDWAKRRVTYGKPIAERRNIQESLAEMARDVWTLRLAVLDAARKVDERGTAGVEADLVKLLARDVSQRVTDEAMLVHGGLGYTREKPVQRFYRDARLTWIEEGTPSIQKGSAARELLSGTFPYDVDAVARDHYDLDDYDPESGDDYTLSYE